MLTYDADLITPGSLSMSCQSRIPDSSIQSSNDFYKPKTIPYTKSIFDSKSVALQDA